jgi:hypothetical protein
VRGTGFEIIEIPSTLSFSVTEITWVKISVVETSSVERRVAFVFAGDFGKNSGFADAE